MQLSKTYILLVCCLVIAFVMAFPPCVVAQLLDRGEPERPINKTHKEWTLTGIGEMSAHDSTDLGFVSYTNQAGVSVTIIRGTFDSDKQSVSELHDTIKSAKKIIEQSLRKDEAGNTVGERVVAVLVQTEPQADLQGVIWTE